MCIGGRSLIYMDNAATTRVTEEVFEAMKPYFCQVYGNPSSVHWAGREARKAVERARRQVACALGADAREIYFTSGGSEADSWALLGAAMAGGQSRRTLVTTKIEHKAVLNAAARLEKTGFTVKYASPGPDGCVFPEEAERLADGDTFMVSTMAANNETGAVQDTAAFADIAHKNGALFHTDAVQAFSCGEWNVHARNIDLLSLSGHKLHAPKGVGALYVKEGVLLSPLIFGGAQERGRRGGTENLAAIVGLGCAAELAVRRREETCRVKTLLLNRLEKGILNSVPRCTVNGNGSLGRVPGITNITFEDVDGEALLLSLDLKHIAVSAGSACTSGSVDPSHVLLAMGRTREQALSSVRFSLSEENTEQEVDEVISAVKAIVEKLRSMKTGR
jgi:cysteine desulfurase